MKRPAMLFKNTLMVFTLVAVIGCLKAPPTAVNAADPVGPQSDRGRGEQRVLMVVTQFADVAPTIPLERVRQKVVEDLDRYVRAQSYGLAWVKADFRGYVRLPDALSAYNVSPYNFQVDRRRVRKLVEDTMSAVEDKVDFGAYDHMLIIPGVLTMPGKGYGMLCYCANPGMLTGVRSDPAFVTLVSKNGKKFNGGVFVGAENAHLGMFAHDFFHALGGVHGKKRLVPCLYDYESQSDASRAPTPEIHARYMGPWDIMSEHFVQKDQDPPGICSFTKIRLGWIRPAQVVVVKPGDTVLAILSPLGNAGDTLVVKIPLNQGRYYLVENRQATGFDRFLPDSGLLVLKVDPEAMEGAGTVRIMDADPKARHFSRATFKLEEGGRNLFSDTDHGIAIIPLWAETGGQAVLVTSTAKAPAALNAALKIQALSDRFSRPGNALAQARLDACREAFRRFEFAEAARLAESR